jgi:uncharacterized membrane protein YoaK (UPF0700 family)
LTERPTRSPASARAERAILVYLLPCIAGAVNGTGFFAIGTYTSHMSGNLARIGDELAAGHFSLARGVLLLVLSFLGGAMIATLLIRHARRKGGAPYWRPLVLECVILFVFATVNVSSERGAHLGSVAMTSLLCLAMGLQNALVTKLSGARLRTTHMTGVVTDIGIELARELDAWWHGGATVPLEDRAQTRERLRLHAAVLGSFLGGAILGPFSYLAVGHIAMLLPMSILACLALFDVRVGLSAASVAPKPVAAG